MSFIYHKTFILFHYFFSKISPPIMLKLKKTIITLSYLAKYPAIILYIYGSYLSASPSLSLSLNEIEVDNICFQHKGRNSQEQYLLSMKLTLYGLVILLQEQIPEHKLFLIC